MERKLNNNMKYLKKFENNLDPFNEEDWGEKNWDIEEENEYPKDFEGFETFYDFLEKNNIVDGFIKAFEHDDKKITKKIYRPQYSIVGVDPSTEHYNTLREYLLFHEKKKWLLLDNPFYKKDTVEGWNFWYNMSNKWLIYDNMKKS